MKATMGCTLFGYKSSIGGVVSGSTVGSYTDTVTKPYVNQTSALSTLTLLSNAHARPHSHTLQTDSPLVTT